METSLRQASACAARRQTEMSQQARIVESLSRPDAYWPGVAAVERVETHFAWVFLTGDRAYKLKKAIRFHGADLRTLAARRHFCAEEVRLNRRLAAPTYLGVVPVVDRDGGCAVGGDGPAVDWIVEMRELDRDRMLDARLRRGDAGPAELRAAVVHLRTLDAAAPAADATALLASLRGRAHEAVHEIARPEFGLPRAVHRELAGALLARLHEAEPLLARRAPHVRDGHGDLRAEHVWLGEPLQIIDALEFDPALRRLDAVEDVAMLAVDTERLAGAWTRRTLCACYEDAACDAVPAVVWQLYLGLRAATRAKVALWHLDDAQYAADPDAWCARALDYLALGMALLECAPDA